MIKRITAALFTAALIAGSVEMSPAAQQNPSGAASTAGQGRTTGASHTRTGQTGASASTRQRTRRKAVRSRRGAAATRRARAAAAYRARRRAESDRGQRMTGYGATSGTRGGTAGTTGQTTGARGRTGTAGTSRNAAPGTTPPAAGTGSISAPRPDVGPPSTAPAFPAPNTAGRPPAGTAGTGATPGAATLVDAIARDPQFSTLTRAIRAAGLEQALRAQGPFTFFAPTNAAFDRLAAGRLDNLMLPENRAQLAALLNYHVVRGRLRGADITRMSNPSVVQSLQGNTLNVVTAPAIGINGVASLLQPDIAAGNGVIHAIDAVLVPPPAGSPL